MRIVLSITPDPVNPTYQLRTEDGQLIENIEILEAAAPQFSHNPKQTYFFGLINDRDIKVEYKL